MLTRGLRRRLKGRSNDVKMLEATSSREEAAWGREETNRGTLRHLEESKD